MFTIQINLEIYKIAYSKKKITLYYIGKIT